MIRRILPTRRDVAGAAFLALVVVTTLLVVAVGMRAPLILGCLGLVALVAYASHVLGEELAAWWASDQRWAVWARTHLDPPPTPDPIDSRYCYRCADPATEYRSIEVAPDLFRLAPVCLFHAAWLDSKP